MGSVLYTIFIYPIELIIELFYVFVLRISNNPALSVLGVSVAVSILTLPLYFIAEKHQRAEHIIQKKMKPETDNIKTVFTGDERFMRLSTYYRQNGYHPLYSLRTSISLIIQIPFFIAAYHFLSNLDIIKDISFGPIANLAKPDSLLSINNITINILPVIMTIINCISSAFYTKGFSNNEKIQLYGMSAIFLILLYNSPSGMVLYWTGNNLFSLIKNIIQKQKRPKLITLSLVFAVCLLLDIYIMFIHDGWIIKRIAISIIFIIIPFLPIFIKYLKSKAAFQKTEILEMEQSIIHARIYILSLLILFLLAGLAIPSSLIASSVHEFSYLGDYVSPFPLIVNTVLQSFGLFLILPLCIFFMFSQSLKIKLANVFTILAGIAIVNVYIFPGKYGYLTYLFAFSENITLRLTNTILNIFVMAIAFALIFLFIIRFRKILVSALAITVCTLVLMSIINIITIYKGFKSLELQLINSKAATNNQIYQFSKKGKNVLVIMLDRGLNGLVPYIFEEKQELDDAFDGFTWYNNTVSFGGHTGYGSPGIFGGYEYTPLEMQKRRNTPLVEKHNEALLLLPRIFLDHGFNVTVTNPPYANYRWIPDLSIFNKYPQINVDNVVGKQDANWLKRNDIKIIDTKKLTNICLIRFSFFKFIPLSFRNFLYDHGKWLSLQMGTIYHFPRNTLSNYIALDSLSDMTKIIDDNINNYNVLDNDLPHEPNFLQFPNYTPANEITNKGDGPFSDEMYYHVNMAALLLLGKWFNFLKDNNIYDNTRIIIVSDHGVNKNIVFHDKVILPNGDNYELYTALLLVKDFNSRGKWSVDNSFMTNADVPVIALKDLVKNPINPWTGKELKDDKADGITLTTSHLWNFYDHSKYLFNIKPNEWMHVHDNIFDINNWKLVTE
jgi:YidC/Oxa1 family membrane protein insertase